MSKKTSKDGQERKDTRNIWKYKGKTYLMVSGRESDEGKGIRLLGFQLDHRTDNDPDIQSILRNIEIDQDQSSLRCQWTF